MKRGYTVHCLGCHRTERYYGWGSDATLYSCQKCPKKKSKETRPINWTGQHEEEKPGY
jgi:hypothetical protein